MNKIPEPLINYLRIERRELLQEAGAMARQLENLARALHKVAEAAEVGDLHTFAWHMESLASQGQTAKALARSASDLARQENLVAALTHDAATAEGK